MSPSTDDQAPHAWRLSRLEERVDKLAEKTDERHVENVKRVEGLTVEVSHLSKDVSRLVTALWALASAVLLAVIGAVLKLVLWSEPSTARVPTQPPAAYRSQLGPSGAATSPLAGAQRADR